MSMQLIVHNHKQFRRASVDSSIEFQISLNNSEHELVLNQCLRVVPGKKIVAEATWGDKKVIAKVFFHPIRAKNSQKREIKGSQVLTEAKIASPRLLHHDACAQDKVIRVVLFEKLLDAEVLNQFEFAIEKNVAHNDIVEQLMDLLAKMHAHGVYQKENHLGNFLLSNNEVYCINFSKLTISSRAINKKVSLNDVAWILSILRITNPLRQKVFYNFYMHLRQWKSSATHFKLFISLFAKWQTTCFEKQQQCWQQETGDCAKAFPSKNIIVRRKELSQTFVKALASVKGEETLSVDGVLFKLHYFANAKQAMFAWRGLCWNYFNGMPCIRLTAIVTSKKQHYHFIAWRFNHGETDHEEALAGIAAAREGLLV